MPNASIIFGTANPMSKDTSAPAMVAASITQETLTADGTTTLTAPSLNTSKPLCRVLVDAPAFVAFGTTPNAAATSPSTTTTPKILLASGVPEYFFVEPGWKCAVDFI